MEKEWEKRCHAIEQGREQEKYLDWLHDKSEGNLYVREALAENGYLLKELAKDETAYIRTTIMTRYPESIKYVLAYQKHKRGLTYDEWALIYETLRMTKTIDADAITDFLSYGIPVGLSYYQGRLDETIPAFKAQLKACRHSLDPIHKTLYRNVDFVEKGKDGKFYSYDFVMSLEADAFTFNGDTIMVDMKQIEYGRDYNADRSSDEYVLGAPEDLVDIRIKPTKVAKIAY